MYAVMPGLCFKLGIAATYISIDVMSFNCHEIRALINKDRSFEHSANTCGNIKALRALQTMLKSYALLVNKCMANTGDKL